MSFLSVPFCLHAAAAAAAYPSWQTYEMCLCIIKKHCLSVKARGLQGKQLVSAIRRGPPFRSCWWPTYFFQPFQQMIRRRAVSAAHFNKKRTDSIISVCKHTLRAAIFRHWKQSVTQVSLLHVLFFPFLASGNDWLMRHFLERLQMDGTFSPRDNHSRAHTRTWGEGEKKKKPCSNGSSAVPVNPLWSSWKNGIIHTSLALAGAQSVGTASFGLFPYVWTLTQGKYNLQRGAVGV